jgi:DNA-3-methyladenine glycosylase I
VTGPRRCDWSGGDPLLVRYHDEEWGVPSRDDRHLFEMLLLDSAQAGLSWLTVLRKREGYRRAFAGGDPARIARFTERDQERLLDDAGIVRNRLKIASAVRNARAWLEVTAEHGSFAAYLWGFVDGRPVQNRFRSQAELPASTPLSDRVSKDLERRGFNFVGSTIVYAFLQSVGVVNDHLVGCFRHREAAALGRAFVRER